MSDTIVTELVAKTNSTSRVNRQYIDMFNM